MSWQRNTPGQKRRFPLLGVLVFLFFAGPGVGAALAEDSAVSFSVEIAGGSGTWISVPVHRPAVFEGEVDSVSGQTIIFTEALDADYSQTHAITVARGEFAGVRGRIVAIQDSGVTIDSGIDLDGVAPGDLIRIVPGWTFASFFPDDFPDGTQVLIFEPRKGGVRLAASTVYEYDAGAGEWYDVVSLAPANTRTIHEADAFVVRDTRPAADEPEDFELVMTGQVSDLIPRVDLSARQENTPYEIHFGIPFSVAVEESGLGEDWDQLLVLPRRESTFPDLSLTYFEGFGWFSGSTIYSALMMEPGVAYVYRKAAPEGEGVETISTVSFLIQRDNFCDTSRNPVPEGSVFGIVVDTDGEGFNAGNYGAFPPFVPGTEPVSLVDSEGNATGDALVFRGEVPADGYIGGALGIAHAAAGGVAETGDPWAIIWFPGVEAGETPRAWDGYGFYTNPGMTVPAPPNTVSYADEIEEGIKGADFLAPGWIKTFGEWKGRHFSPEEQEDPLWSEPGGDPGGYGIPNLLRYAFNLDPRRPEAAGLPGVTTGIPEGEADEYLMIRYPKYLVADDLEFRIQASDDLLEWTTLGDEFIVEEEEGDDGTTDIITQRDSIPISEGRSRFLRVKVRLTEEEP